MNLEGDVVIFKSEPYYFKQERDGVKPNSERLLTRAEMLLIKPDEETLEIEHIKRIRIECTVIDKKYVSHSFGSIEPFERKLTSINPIGEFCGAYLYVFSWRHVPFTNSELVAIRKALIGTSTFWDRRRELREKIDKMLEEVEDEML